MVTLRKKNVAAVFGFIALLVGVSGCWPKKSSENDHLKVINVLDVSLYNDCHIKGSMHVPFDEFENQARKWLKDHKDDMYVVYCSNYSCTASGYAAKMLKKMGFTHVWAYEAGMAGWYQAGMPCEGPAREAYLTMENVSHKDMGTGGFDVLTTEELKELMDKEWQK